jgi:hypothetical protein
LKVAGVPAVPQELPTVGGFSPGTPVWQLEVYETAVQPGKISPAPLVTRMP